MSTNRAPPMRELRVPNQADGRGGQPIWGQSGEMGLFPLSNLPQDVILDILGELRPDGPYTTPESVADNPIVSPGRLECRTSLFNVSLASRTFYELAIPHLYRNPLVKNRWELFRFFCALAKHADRRPIVRSFAWAGVMWEDSPDAESSIRRLEDEATISIECWDSVKDHWPRGSVDVEIAKLLGIDGPNTWRLLGAILAMCPRIKRLFMVNGAIIDRSSGIHHCPELDAVLPFLRRYDLGSQGEFMDGVRPYGHPFLHGLEMLTIEGHSNMAASINTSELLVPLFLNLPGLRRVEIKYPPPFREVLDILGSDSPLTAGVNEVSLLFAKQPQDDMAAIVALFPNLTSLYAEFRDGSSRPPDIFDQPPAASEALLKVSGTLEALSLTTSPETYPATGHWVKFKSYPPSLSTLNEMSKLKDLTTESIWLFGTEDPAVALQLPDLLPRSLVRLHLIDYWGNSDPAEFYPEFPDSCTPLEFYTRVFGILCSGAPVSLPELKEVTFTSNFFDSHLQPRLLNAGQGEEGETTVTDDLIQSVRRSFDQVGITFRIILRGTAT